eukprot:SM000013S26416  [mRNA]  locus=s13:192323:194900:- [translate_table: standard]
MTSRWHTPTSRASPSERRISAALASPDAAAVLVNSHFDSALGSPGAADCASCVAAMLEVFRQLVDGDLAPAAPVVLLFNGGEEIFMVGAHGFVSSHPWAATIGAVINLEATGTALPELVVQSGPGAWPARVYAHHAVHPAANVVAQDIFPLVPGDTDYRVFSADFDNVPGLDCVFLLNGYAYHTLLDTPEALEYDGGLKPFPLSLEQITILPGALQVRGENLLALVRGFASSPELQTRAQRQHNQKLREGTPVYFDIFGLYVVYYSRKTALCLHIGLLVAALGGILLLEPDGGIGGEGTKASSRRVTLLSRLAAVGVGALAQAAAWVLAMLLPTLVAAAKVAASGASMTCPCQYARPAIAGVVAVPAALAGLLLPYWGLPQEQLVGPPSELPF